MALNKVSVNSLFIIISFCFMVSSKSFAQSKLNFGLTRQQPSATLPVGLSKHDIPQKKSKAVILTKLKIFTKKKLYLMPWLAMVHLEELLGYVL